MTRARVRRPSQTRAPRRRRRTERRNDTEAEVLEREDTIDLDPEVARSMLDIEP